MLGTPAVCISKPLWAAAEADPLIVVEMASSTDLRGGGGGLRGSLAWIPRETITTLEMFPDAAELVDTPQVAPLVRRHVRGLQAEQNIKISKYNDISSSKNEDCYVWK